MIGNRIVMAKYRESQVGPGPHYCDCQEEFVENETVALYPQIDPIMEAFGVEVREVVCMTCHFWNVHEFVESEL